jgi:hypothetical protein
VSEHTHGWIRIGRFDDARRRSLWSRVRLDPETLQYMKLELAAGREGNDARLTLDMEDPTFAALVDVITTAEFAVDECNLTDQDNQPGDPWPGGTWTPDDEPRPWRWQAVESCGDTVRVWVRA